MTYLAEFSAGSTRWRAAAISWSPAAPLIPEPWQKALVREPSVRASVRTAQRSAPDRAAVILAAPADDADRLARLREHLIGSCADARVETATSAAAFDAIAGDVWPVHIAIEHRGYHHGGAAVGCEFRLYNSYLGHHGQEPASYQVNLRTTQGGAELERLVRKRLAWLEIERPFSEAVRDVQVLILRRLLEPSVRVAEFIAVPDQGAADAWLSRLRTEFDATTRRIGFKDVPFEVRDCSEWLTTGLHPSDIDEIQSDLSCTAAESMSMQELACLLGALSAGMRPATTATAKNHVFISYASSDGSIATATCQFLESNGVRCWIAPRDAERSADPYPVSIEKGVHDARVMVVLLSALANASVHIPREVDLALERRITVIPLRLQRVLPEGSLNYLLRTCQWLEGFDREWPDVYRELLDRLQTVR